MGGRSERLIVKTFCVFDLWAGNQGQTRRCNEISYF